MAPTTDSNKDQQNLEQAIEKLRKVFFEKYDQEKSDDYEESDIQKLREDDATCERYIRHQQFNVDKALEHVKESLKWRKEFGLHGIKESNLSAELLKDGAVHHFNHDKEGNPILMFIVKMHKKDAEKAEDQRRFIVYWVDKLLRESPNHRITVIYDCTGSGYSNMDLDMTLFITNLFIKYYPASLGHLFVYDMPWLFNTIWKVIKPLLPKHSRDKVKFVNKDTIKEYVDVKCLPVRMGGERADHDNEHIEEYKKACKEQLEQFMGQGTEMPPNNELHDDDDNIPKPKRVYLDVKPGPILQFSQPDCKERKTAFLVLTNVYDRQIGFRIRCNSTESFKVRPFSGVLQIGSSIDVSIHLLEGHSINGREKFLIQAIPVGHGKLSSASFKALWDNSHHSKQMEYKIKCQYEKDEKEVVEEVIKPVFVKDLGSAELTRPKAPSNGHDHQIISLEASIRDLKYWNSLLKIAVFFLLLLNFLFFTNYFFHQQISHHSSNFYNLIFPTTENSQRSEENEPF